MYAILAVLLAVAAPASVEEQFARTRAAVERANGLEFNFELRGTKTVSGWAGVVPNGPMLVSTPDFVLWSDGKDVELRAGHEDGLDLGHASQRDAADQQTRERRG
jgi:hypothetical protein